MCRHHGHSRGLLGRERLGREEWLQRLESYQRDLEQERTKTDSVYEGRPDLVRRVERLFATDFELYGY